MKAEVRCQSEGYPRERMNPTSDDIGDSYALCKSLFGYTLWGLDESLCCVEAPGIAGLQDNARNQGQLVQQPSIDAVASNVFVSCISQRKSIFCVIAKPSHSLMIVMLRQHTSDHPLLPLCIEFSLIVGTNTKDW